MSEPVGAAVRVAILPPRGMITVRGDLASVALKNAVTGVAGVDFPGQRQINHVAERGIGWMSPDELLVLVPHAEAAQAVVTMRATLAGEHSLAVNVSDARAMFHISGPGAREALAKLAPVDLSPAAFGPGTLRRTRAAQVPVALWLAEDDAFTLICFRSVANYMFELLKNAAAPGGAVGYFTG
ncbi:sarcosine oxidase subunit gamma [Actibacterium sp. D379-3]